MHFCDVCRIPANYYVANPGSNPQGFCTEHLPRFLNLNMPFVTLLTQEYSVRVPNKPVVEETPVVKEPVAKTPAPKVRKKAAVTPVTLDEDDAITAELATE